MTRDGPAAGVDGAAPDDGVWTSTRDGRRVRVLSALSGARRRSVMTAPGMADGGGHREVLAQRRPAAGRPGQAGRTSGWVLGGSVRVSLRIGSPPPVRCPVAEAVVHRVTRCPVPRPGDSAE